jgi:hypothetical protein
VHTTHSKISVPPLSNSQLQNYDIAEKLDFKGKKEPTFITGGFSGRLSQIDTARVSQGGESTPLQTMQRDSALEH